MQRGFSTVDPSDAVLRPIQRPLKWQCPYCQHHTIVPAGSTVQFYREFNLPDESGSNFIVGDMRFCPNPECQQFTLEISHTTVHEIRPQAVGGIKTERKHIPGDVIKTWRLYPETEVKIFSADIPDPILQDYTEACLIRDKSPKASATLSRRCIQGMIRGFWGISKDRLVDEIKALEGLIDDDLWEAIDNVRKIGNIGAHMEKDINVIVDVDSGEAGLLIELIETLFQEWYMRDEQKKKNLAAIKATAAEKATTKRAGAHPAAQAQQSSNASAPSQTAPDTNG